MTEIADSLTWLKGRHAIKLGADLRWERLNVVQPPSPTGSFTFSNLFTDLPGVANTGTPLASFLLGQVQQFSIDLQQDQIRNRAHFQEYFVQDDWRLSDRVTVNAGVRYTLNFPSTEVNNQAAVFNLQTQQLEYLGQDGQPRAARELHKLNFGPRLGIVGRVTDKTVVAGRLRAGLDRDGGHHDAVHDAGLSVPADGVAAHARQHRRRRSCSRRARASRRFRLTPDAGLGQGVFSVDRDLGSGYVQQWNASVQRELTLEHRRSKSPTSGSKITHVGIPDTNLNQLTVDQLALGSAAAAAGAESVLRHHSALLVARRSDDPGGAAAQAVSASTRPSACIATTSARRSIRASTSKLEQRLSHGLSYLVSYTRSKLIDDASSVFDASILTGPVANYPVADSFNRTLERDYSTGDIPHVFVASAVWDLPFGASRRIPAGGVARRARQRLDADRHADAAVGHADRGDAGDQQQRLRRLRHPAAESRPAIPTLPADERTVSRWFDTGAFATAPQFTLGTARAIRCAARATATSTSR